MKIINRIKIISIATALICSSCLSGCFSPFKKNFPDLPADPIEFEMKDSDSFDMMTITYNGKAYMPFGIIKHRINYDESLRECLGYIDNDKDTRVYTLYQDPYDNYLMIKNVSGFMDQPQFWRKCETRKKDIYTPDYIESLNYEEWTGSGVCYEMPAVRIDVANEADDVVELAIDYKLNGKDGGVSGSRNADMSVMKKGEDINLSIDEYAIEDKLGEIEKDDSFDIDVTFSVTATDGKTYDVDGSLSANAKLEDSIRMTLTGDSNNGYSIYKMAGF